MKKKLMITALAVFAVLALSVDASAQYGRRDSDFRIDVGLFYDRLDPYGDWVEMPDYGWAFAPRVSRYWRPYTRGRWLLTDDGWYWDSYERFGWATYHYGRWVNDPYYGWVWVPGYEWAPAWVSWRHGRGYIGWAPLPPRVTWQARIGLRIGGLDIDAYLGARDYMFVPDRSFTSRSVYDYVLPPARNVSIINITNNITNYSTSSRGTYAYNGGVPVAAVEQAVGRSIPRVRTVEANRVEAVTAAPTNGARTDQITVYRPQVTEAPTRDQRPSRGRSLVQGETPPPQMIERRRARDEERRQAGSEFETTARDVQQRGGRGRGEDEPAARPQGRPAVEEQERQRLQTQEQQSVERERAQQQQQQRDQQNREQRQLEQRQREQTQQETERQRAQAQQQQQQREQQAREQQQREQQQRDRQAIEQRQRDQAQQEAERQRVQAQEQQRVERQQQQQREQQMREQQQREQQQRDRQAVEQRQREQAQQEAERQRAQAQEQQRVEREKQQQQQREQQPQPRQREQSPKQEKQEKKEENRKNPKPTPTPQGL